MDVSFWSSMLTEMDYSVIDLTAKEVSIVLKPYAWSAFGIYFTMELIKMMYMRQPMDLSKLLIAFIILNTLPYYTDIVKEFDKDLNGIYKSLTTLSGNNNQALSDATVGSSSNVAVQASTMVRNSLKSGSEKIDLFDELGMGDCTSFIHLIMSGLRKTLLLFLYCIGPVSLVLSMFPLFGIKVLKNWFFYTLSVHFWELGYIILQMIQGKIGFYHLIDNGGVSGQVQLPSGNELAWFGYNFTNFICFMMIPYLTSKMMIGLTQGSSFGSKSFGAATAVAGYAMGAAKGGVGIASKGLGGGSSGGGGKGSVSNPLQSMAKGAEDSGGDGSNGSNSFAGGVKKMYGNVSKGFKGTPVT